ncbi:hypothetical protein AVEN_23772-1 [Araneus ventricosus]|uniref:Uncharacterized protein n=1 Tax=Araneus ventricosus TaxID=182803 RepID=A0A4Y2HMC3_ARAVE|nr:hypothetical protein AVEN_23772-1 [Araneus ventricosus]
MGAALDQVTRSTPELAFPCPRKGVWPTKYDLARNRPTYMAYLPWNRVSNLEPSYIKAEALLLGHRNPMKHRKSKHCYCQKIQLRDFNGSPRFRPS